MGQSCCGASIKLKSEFDLLFIGNKLVLKLLGFLVKKANMNRHFAYKHHPPTSVVHFLTTVSILKRAFLHICHQYASILRCRKRKSLCLGS